MLTHDSEFEMEEFLHRLVPNIDAKCHGATDAQIAEIEHIAGRPLPRFYHWFLRRMGRDMGPIAYPTLDFSAAKVIECYQKNIVDHKSQFLMIGYESNEFEPLHLFYDLSHEVRNDAFIVHRYLGSDSTEYSFENFREMLAWGIFVSCCVECKPRYCIGTLMVNSEDVLTHLRPIMQRLGFKQPISTGSFLGLFETNEYALAVSTSPDGDPYVQTFRFGGLNTATIRGFLGEISTNTSIEVEISEWMQQIT